MNYNSWMSWYCMVLVAFVVLGTIAGVFGIKVIAWLSVIIFGVGMAYGVYLDYLAHCEEKNEEAWY